MFTEKTDIIPAAYIGVSGEKLRVRVPVKTITLIRAEGPSDLCGIEQTYSTWHGVDWQLQCNQKTMMKDQAGYDKHDFTVTWADGTTYSGRYDLENKGQVPSLADHVRSYLTYLAEDPRAERITTPELRASAAAMLITHDMSQLRPDLAPDDWLVVRDYNDCPIIDGEVALERQVYATELLGDPNPIDVKDPASYPPYGKTVRCLLRSFGGREIMADLIHSDEEDLTWRFAEDKSELDEWNWSVVNWRPVE